jgi:arsenite-transporting ATPase
MGIHLPFTAEMDKTLDWKELLLPKLVICSGKGGVGKTTVTAALASARARAGKRVLVVSVDPAHSLGDSLCIDLSDGLIHPVPGFAALHAQEPKISAGSASASQPGLARDDSDDPDSIQRLVGDVFLPVSEELNIIHAIVQMWRMLRQENLVVDEIYVDGSPSGHMLRALHFPFRMNEYLGKLGKIADGLKRVLVFDAKKRDMLKGRAAMADSFKAFIAVLSNPAIATTVLVTIPETMALAETERTFDALKDMGIHVTNLVINKIHDRDSMRRLTCPFCAERARNEALILHQIEDRLGSRNLTITRVPLFDNEIRGPSALAEVGSYLLDPPRGSPAENTAKASCF